MRSDLQNDKPVGQPLLAGEVDAPERAGTELGEQAKAEKLMSNSGHRRHRVARGHSAVARQSLQLVAIRRTV